MDKIAIIDLDDTIVDLVPCFLESFNKRYNQNLKPQDWLTYDMYVNYGITPDEFSNFLIEYRILENAKPINRSMDILHNVENRGYDIHFLTARGWHPNGYQLTKNWLLTNGFPLRNDAHLHIMNLGIPKSKYITETFGKKIDLVIDDNAHHVRSFIVDKMADRIFLINQPWNLLDEDLEYHRIADINEIDYFIEIGYI